jgi:hypothetical protein
MSCPELAVDALRMILSKIRAASGVTSGGSVGVFTVSLALAGLGIGVLYLAFELGCARPSAYI